jgi:hypothetical protein
LWLSKSNEDFRLLFGDYDGVIHFFSLAGNALESKFTHKVTNDENFQKVTSVCAISPNFFATAQTDGSVVVWCIEGDNITKKYEIQDHGVSYGLISLSGSRLCWKNGDCFYIWNYQSTENFWKSPQLFSHVNEIQYYSEEEELLVVTSRGQISLFDSRIFSCLGEWILSGYGILISVNKISENLWAIVFHYKTVWYRPQERFA